MENPQPSHVKKLAALFFTFFLPIKGFSAIVPSTILPGQVERQLRNNISVSTEEPKIFPKTIGTIPVQSISSIPPRDQHPFVLRSICIEGSTVYTQRTLSSFFQPYLNKEISYKQFEEMTSQITLKYVKDGYILSYAHIPAQNLNSGHITIKVVEAYVANIRVEGKIYGIEKFIAAYSKKIQQSRPLRLEVLQHYNLLLNRLPGVKATLQLNPISQESGAQDLAILITQRRFTPNFVLNNNQSRYLGSENLFVTANLYSMLQGGDSTVVTAATAPTQPSVLQYYYLYHTIPIGLYGKHLDFLADFVQTHPNNLQSSVNSPEAGPLASLTGKSGDLISYYYHPFILLTNEKLEGRLAFGYYLSRTTGFNAPFNSVPDVKVQQPTLRAKAIYERVHPKYIDRLETEISQGIHIFGANISPGDSDNPSLDYTKIYYYATHTQTLYKNFSFLIDSMGQYGFTPLIPAEKIAYGGGLPFGRAYDPAEIIGDSGIMGGLELRYDHFSSSFNSIQYYARYDIGKMWNRTTSPIFALNPIYSDASLSAGIRLFLTKDFNLELCVARPMTMPVQSQVISGHNGKSLRYFFNFSYLPF